MGSGVILPAPGQPATGPDPNFISAATPSAVKFTTDQLSPPSQLYLTRDDQINVVIYNSFPGANVFMNGRFLLPAGTTLGQPGQPGATPAIGAPISLPLVVPWAQNFFPTSNRARNVFIFPLFEGFLLGAQVFVSDNGIKRGQLFAYIQLARGNPTFSVGSQTLYADYVVGGIATGWPYGRVQHPTDGPGWIHSLQQANPAAGADWIFTCPTGARMRVASFNAQFVASATVANRNVELIVDDGVNVVWRTTLSASITAGTTQQVSATGTNVPTGVITTDSEFVIPPTLILAAGWRIRTATTGIQVGDQWSNIWFNMEEWLEP